MAETSNTTKETRSRVLGLAGPLLFFLLVLIFAFRGNEWVETLSEATRARRETLVESFFKLCLWLAGAHLLNRALTLFIWDGVASRALGGSVPRLLRDFTAFTIYFIAFTGIVAFVFDKSITGLWATSGALGLVVGFALRGLILDIFTGLAINIDRPYRLGDWITVQGARSEQNVTGQVVDMNWRTTRLQTEENVLVVIPNSLFGSVILSNYYSSGQATRFETGFYVDYSVPSDRVRRVMLAGAKAVLGQKNILHEPEPNVVADAATELGVYYKVRYWITPWNKEPPAQARSLINASVLDHLRQAGITPAYPKRDTFVARLPARQWDAQSREDSHVLLGRVELFKELAEADLRLLGEAMHHHFYPAGSHLIRRGEPGSSMFVLVEGLLEVLVDPASTGQEVAVAKIAPGQFFGEMSLLTGEPRSATVVTLTDAVAYEITKEHFDKLLERSPAILEAISGIVAARRLRNAKAAPGATSAAQAQEVRTLARQILERITAFFRRDV